MNTDKTRRGDEMTLDREIYEIYKQSDKKVFLGKLFLDYFKIENFFKHYFKNQDKDFYRQESLRVLEMLYKPKPLTKEQLDKYHDGV